MSTPYYEFEKDPNSKSAISMCSLISSAPGDKGYHTSPHWHTSIELLYFLQDSADVLVGANYYDINSGDLIIINAGEIHSITAEKEKTPTHLVLKIMPQLLYISGRDSFEANYLIPFTISGLTKDRLIPKSHLDGSPIVPLINEIYDEFNSKSFGYELSIQANISKVFLWILRYWESQGIQVHQLFQQHSKDYKRLDILFKYVQDNYQNPISVRDMAKLCNMNYSYFSRYFKNLTGKTFVDYVNYIRLSEAEKLLISTNLNITEIAFETGFSSASYFIKMFKIHRGITPHKMKSHFLKNKSDKSDNNY